MSVSSPVVFRCMSERLVGIVEEAGDACRRGVVVVVGGPQYRVGSHRQFVILSRQLAAAGFTTLRFDHRGVGDSDGDTTFEQLQPDLRAAVDLMFERYGQLEEIVLWGLCDAASAILMYAAEDERVAGIVILNPWVHSQQTHAKSTLSGYYAQRLLEADFWRHLLSGGLDVSRSLGDFWRNLRTAFRPARRGAGEAGGGNADLPFQVRMMQGLAAFGGRTFLILSGKDLTAREFRIFANGNRKYRKLLERERVRTIEFEEADHTFSTAAWRERVSSWTIDWLSSW